MQANVEGKTVLITGATQGIGRAIALECANSGAEQVVISGLDQGDGDTVVEEIRSLGCKAEMVTENLSQPGGADRLFDSSIKF